MKKILVIFAVSAFFYACSKNNLPEPGNTTAKKMASEWWVTVADESGVLAGGAHFKIATYNTTENNDSIWVDDFENIFGFKCKAKADYPSQAFAVPAGANEYFDIDPSSYPETIAIANGKVLTRAGKSKTGVVTDSIYFEAKFPGDNSTYKVAGTARTNWPDDDY